MNSKVSVLTLEDGKDYVVLEQIMKDNHNYLILFEDENPKNIYVTEFFSEPNTYIEILEDSELKTSILKEFFTRHPEFQE